MKVLLDVCTPVQVKNALLGHEVHTAAERGWRELENGALLRAAEAQQFEVFVICDKNLRYHKTCAQRPWEFSNSGRTIVPLWRSISLKSATPWKL